MLTSLCFSFLSSACAQATEKKVLAPSKQARMAELREQLAQLPTWPEYANLLNDHQYDNLNLDIVRVMTSAILDNKTALEQRISKMVFTASLSLSPSPLV